MRHIRIEVAVRVLWRLPLPLHSGRLAAPDGIYMIRNREHRI